MKIIKYTYLAYEYESDTGVERTFLEKAIPWSEEAEEIAKDEAYNGRYSIEDATDEELAEYPGTPPLMTLLWENARPTSSFGGQTVPLDLSNYSQVLVYFRVYNGTGEYAAETFGVYGLVGNWCMAACNSETGSNPTQRAFNIETTGITFSQAYYINAIGGTLNGSTNLLIPYKIYGIKGVSQ